MMLSLVELLPLDTVRKKLILCGWLSKLLVSHYKVLMNISRSFANHGCSYCRNPTFKMYCGSLSNHNH